MTRYPNAILALPFHIHNFQNQPMIVQACLGSSYIFSTQSSMITRKNLRLSANRPTTIHLPSITSQSTFFHIFFILPKPTAPHHFIDIACRLCPLYRRSIRRYSLSRSFSASCFVGLSVSSFVSHRHRHCVGPCARITGLSCDLPELGTHEGAEIV